MIFYAFTALGFGLLALDIAGGLTADTRGLLVRKGVGIAAAIFTGFAPLLLWKTGWLGLVGPEFPVFAYAFLTALAVYLIGLLVRPNSAISRWVSRIGYLALLLLASLPSFVLLVLAAPAPLAAFGLTRPR